MKIPITVWQVFIAILFTSMCCLQQSPAMQANNTIRLTKKTLTDPGSRNLPSHTVLVPNGWKVTGGGFWAHSNFFRILPSQNIVVTSPQGPQITIGPSLGMYDFIPSRQAKQWGAKRPQDGMAVNGYLAYHYPTNMDQWKSTIENKLLPKELENATDITVKRVSHMKAFDAMVEKGLRPIRQQQQRDRQMYAMSGMTVSCEGKVISVELEYKEGGRLFEEIRIFKVQALKTKSQTGQEVSWCIEGNFIFRAPKGDLEKATPTLIAIATSLRVTPKWRNMVQNHIRKMNGIDRKGFVERSRIVSETNREISDIMNEGYRRRNKIRDAGHRKFVNAINEVDEYTTADNTYVKLPSGYNHVFFDGDDNFVLTNTDYDPNSDVNSNSNWKRLRLRR